MIIDYDGLTFNDDIPDTNGSLWYVTALEGWDSPPIRTFGVDPTSRHGEVISKGLLGSRPLVMKGVVKSPDLATHYAAASSLDSQMNNIFATKTLTVSEEIDKQLNVVRVGEMRKRLLGNCAFEFEVSLRAPDPLKYPVTPTSTTITAGTTKIIINPGSFVTERVTLKPLYVGLVSVANLTVSTRGVVTDSAVGENTIFDALGRKVITVDGRSAYGALAAVSSWWGLQPGNNTVKNSGPGIVSVSYYPAWL